MEIAAQYAKHLTKSELVQFSLATEEMSGDISDVCQQAKRHWASPLHLAASTSQARPPSQASHPSDSSSNGTDNVTPHLFVAAHPIRHLTIRSGGSSRIEEERRPCGSSSMSSTPRPRRCTPPAPGLAVCSSRLLCFFCTGSWHWRRIESSKG